MEMLRTSSERFVRSSSPKVPVAAFPSRSTLDRFLKRSFDVLAGTVGLALLFPILLLIAALIRLDDSGPIFFRQNRVGKDRRLFSIWKFRTMQSGPTAHDPGVTARGDSRITQVGAILRRWKLDELPQLVNVVAGDMSLVGPRPELPRFVALYNEAELEVLQSPPGITDPASLRYRNEEHLLATHPNPEQFYRETLLHEKLALNLEYQKTATFYSDLTIIARTIAAVFQRT